MLNVALVLALAAAPPARTSPAAERAITADAIRAHVRFLASDLLEGRGPGTRGDALAQSYIAAQLEALGLRPAGTQGFLQPFDIVGVDGHAETVQFSRGRESLVLRHAEEVVAVAGDEAPRTAVDRAELVFVGYGIRAPEYGWDDFKGQNLRGKMLLILNSDPEDDPALFAGRARLWYGRWDYKYEMAARVGAAGAIILHTTHSAGYPWQVVRSSWTGPQYSVPTTERRVPLRGWVTEEACRKLVALAGRSLDDLVRSANGRQFQPVPLGIGVSTAFDSRIERTRTSNVLALLPGSDPKLSSEVVLYTAHHDHLGMRTGAAPGEDAIYNGAEDNASGVALMLTVARAYAALDRAPRRSILFAAVAAEEQGLLGSEYLARHPPVPLGRIAVNINIDGANVFGRTRDVTVIGLGKTDLDVTLRTLARAQGRVLRGDQLPDRGYFYRSDQFSFARVGVPSAYFESGLDYRGRPAGWGREKREAWEETRYHQPSDELTPDWDLSGAVEDARLQFALGYSVAQATPLPAWTKGDEFEAPRLRSLEALRQRPPGSTPASGR
ncbi:MAG: M28 family peptidase [Myxococcaceae bacterium]|nr:MAG: M28 family peptidase [Myxococcaceae bacterium]